MNFDFDEDQYFIKNDARRFLSDRCSMDMVRTYLDSDATEISPLWQEIVELGWLGVAIPEEYGGLGMGYLELCVIAEELGRVVAPVPFSSSIYLAAEAIVQYGSEEQKQQYLPAIASGELIGTMAWSEKGAWSESSVSLSNQDGSDAVVFDNGFITGVKRPVSHGMLADIAVVTARNTEGETVLVLVELCENTLQRKPLMSVDPSQRNAELSFDRHPALLLGKCEDAQEALDNVLNRAAILYAFEQVGGAQRCQELAVEYVKERKTFSRQVGSYQAVKHKLARMYAQNELARSNAYYGAWALASGSEELPLAAAAARISATNCFEFAAREGLHLHGGMGYTWEVDCHLYLKRSRDLALKVGSSRCWNEKLIATALACMNDTEKVPTWLANS